MAVKPITVGDQFQGGRVTTQDASIGPTFIRYVDNDDLGTDELQFQFPTAAASGLTFGQARTVFIDNSFNDYAMIVVVSGTQHTFPIPANSTGFYLIDNQGGSSVTVSSAGNPNGPVEFIFYNYERTPFVWYKFGASTTAVTVADGADVTLGSIADAAVTNPALSATAISLLKGIISKLTTGAAGTAVTIADGADIAEGAQADAAVTNPTLSGSVIALLKGVLTAVNTVATQIVTVVTNTGNTATNVNTVNTTLGTTNTNTANTKTSVDAVNTTLGTTNTNTGNTATNTASIVTNTNAFSFNNITTSTTTVVKNAPGTLGKITVNSAGGVGSIIIYDNIAGSGTIIATLDSAVVGSFDYNVLASVGVTVVTTGAPDITVTYK